MPTDRSVGGSRQGATFASRIQPVGSPLSSCKHGPCFEESDHVDSSPLQASMGRWDFPFVVDSRLGFEGTCWIGERRLDMLSHTFIGFAVSSGCGRDPSILAGHGRFSVQPHLRPGPPPPRTCTLDDGLAPSHSPRFSSDRPTHVGGAPPTGSGSTCSIHNELEQHGEGARARGLRQREATRAAERSGRMDPAAVPATRRLVWDQAGLWRRRLRRMHRHGVASKRLDGSDRTSSGERMLVRALFRGELPRDHRGRDREPQERTASCAGKAGPCTWVPVWILHTRFRHVHVCTPAIQA